jgi:hypothetical protein
MLLGCAMGSTSYNEYTSARGGARQGTGKKYSWQKGYNNNNICDGNNCSLFKMSKLRIDKLKENLTPNNNSKVIAILWLQGEADSHIIGNGSSYKSGVAQMLKDLRSYAVQKFPQSSSGFPILMGGLSTYESSVVNMNPIIQDIVRINTSSNFKFVPSDASLGSKEPKFNHNLRPNKNSDSVHFSKMAQIELGYRYFYVYNTN